MKLLYVIIVTTLKRPTLVRFGATDVYLNQN